MLQVFNFPFLAGYTTNKNKGITPQSEQSETAPRSFPPSSSGYRSYLQPRAYFPSPKVSEWRSSKSPAQTSQQEPRGSPVRQVDGYSQPGSFSSYRPASHPLKPAQQPQSRVYQASAVPWDSLLPQNEKKFGTRIVSSGAIEFLSEPKPLHKVPPVTGERFPGSNVPQRPPAGTYPNVMPTQKEESSPAGVIQTKDIMWNLPQSRSGLQQSRPTHSNAMASQRPSSQSSGVLQSKKGMWNIGSQSPGGDASTSRSEKYKKPTSRVEGPQSSGSFQPIENVWNLPQSGSTPRRQSMVHTNTMSSQRNAASPTSVLQTKEIMWNMPQSQSRTTTHSNAKPAQRKPSSPSSVLQTKEGMWSLHGSNAPNQGTNARGFRPMGLEQGQSHAQSQQQQGLSRKPVQQTFSQVPNVQTKGQMQRMAAPGRGSGITGHATVSYSNPPRGRSSQSSPTKILSWDRSDSNQKTKGASGMASLTSLYQFDGDRPKLLPSTKKNKALP